MRPVDAICGVIRAGSEQIGQLIGANDLLIAARALALDPTVVTDNEREFLRMMTFGSRTGYGKSIGLAAISSPDLQRDRRQCGLNWSTSQRSLASRRAIEPNRRLIRYDALQPRASAKSRRGRWPVYPTRRPRRRSDDCPGDELVADFASHCAGLE